MRKRLLAALLCMMMVLTLLPATALAADATVQYLQIDVTESDPTCTYKSPNTADGANGVLITGGDAVYALTGSWDFVIVNGASVTYEGTVNNFFVLGSGKLTLDAGNVEVTRGSYEGTYSGATGNELLTFLGGIPEAGKTYSYNYTDNYGLVGCLDAYDVTVAAEKTLTVTYDTNTSGENPTNPDEHQSILRVAHKLTVSGKLAADADQRLEIGEKATVSGVKLYDDNGTSEYTLSSEHYAETFAYTNTAADGQPAVWRWVRQNQAPAGPSVPEDGKFTLDWDDGTPQDGTAAAVTYQIGSASVVTAVKQGEGQNASDISIGTGMNLTITYQPRSDASGFWGFRVTRRGKSNTVSDVTDVTKNDQNIYSYTVERGDSENAGLLVEIFENDPNHGGEPQNPGFRIRYDNHSLTATYKINDQAAVTAEDMRDIDYPGTGSVALTFGIVAAQPEQPENHFYGITVFDGGNRKYIKAGSDTLPLTGNTYTYSMTDFSKSLEIEALSQPAPFDGEFMVEYEQDSERTVSVSSSVADNKDVKIFTANEPVSFSLSKTAYKVECSGNDGTSVPLLTVSESAPYVYSYTPATTDGFTVRVYWTAEEYNYAALREEEGEFMVEFRWEGSGTVTLSSPAPTDFATYGNSTRVVLENGTTHLDLTVTPDEEQTVSEVRQDGTKIPDFPEAGGQYSFPLTENNRSGIEVRFTGGGQGPVGNSYTVTVEAGDHGSIRHYVDGNPQTGSATVFEGVDLFFEIIPEPGYVVESITIDEGPEGQVLTGPFSAGTEQYTFTNVQANHRISATFEEYAPEPQSNDPKTLIDRKEFAYSGADAAAIKAKFVQELWDTVFQNNDQQGAITTRELLASKVTLENAVSNSTVRTDGTRYPFTVELEGEDATGVVYTLNSERDFVLRTTVGETKTYTVIESAEMPEGPYSVIKAFDENGIYVFGNGTFLAPLETCGSGIAAGHILNIGTPTLTQIGCQLVVYQPGFTGTRMEGAGEANYAAAWGFARFPVIGTGATTQAAPAEAELYFGNSSVTLSKPGTPGLGVAGIASVESLLPSGAVTITGNDGTFCVTFNSNFYNEVKLKITYDLTGGGSRSEYLTIRRVGIEIVGYDKGSDTSISTNHGTDPGYHNANFWSGSDDYAVFGTYYYPTGTSTGDSVDDQTNGMPGMQLYATYTWKDGAVTTKLLNSTEHLDAHNRGNSVATDDFVLWRGVEAQAPVRISVTAVKPGSSSTVFSGAALGSGAGVEWVYIPRV